MKLVFLMLISFAISATAEPIVIRDYGGKSSGVPDRDKIANLVMQQSIKPINNVSSERFPLRSTMRAGVLATPKRFEEKLLNRTPFFVVSNDEQSRNWIDANRSYLSKINAKGFVTNIASENEYRSLEEFAKPLILSAVPVDELVQSLGLKVYPILVTSEEIAQ